MSWTFHILHKRFDKNSFDCGSEPLNDYLKKYARQNHDSGLSRCFVAVSADDKIIGYYTLSSGQVMLESLPEEIRNRLPRYPVPINRIGRLAIDKSMQGKGLGRELMGHAIQNIVKVSETLGTFAIVVVAKNDEAVSFYKKFGFAEFPENGKVLFIPLSAIQSDQN